MLEAAGRLFYRDGIAATGVDAVSATAGTGKMSMYRHFPGGKDELVAAVLAEHDEPTVAALVEAATALGATPRERLLAAFDVIDALSAHDTWRGCRFLSAAAELRDPGHPARAHVVAHKRRTRDALRAWAAEAGVPQDALDRVSSQLLLLIDGALVDSVVRPGEHPALEARALADLLLRDSSVS